MRGFGVKSTSNLTWLEKEKPVAGPLDVIVKPVVVAPCSSDVHSAHGGAGEITDTILGHEAVGVIVEVGILVERFKVGDKVVVPCCTPDWLAMGVQGKYNTHDHFAVGSFKFLDEKDGVFAEFFHVNHADANLIHLPEDMAPEAALMAVDMMSSGFHGVEQAEIAFGDTVAVLGIGPVGLMAVAGAALRGAGRIMVVGTRPNCIQIAEEYGATDIVSYKKGDIVEQILALNNGEGVDSVIVAGGDASTLTQAISMTKPGGIVSNISFIDVDDVISIPSTTWTFGLGNVDIRGGFCPGGAMRMKKMIEVIKHGRVDPTKLITHRFYGFEKIEEAFELMDKKPAELIKPVVFID